MLAYSATRIISTTLVDLLPFQVLLLRLLFKIQLVRGKGTHYHYYNMPSIV